ncbi:hypothetical protein BVRB_032860, partial [Beta vulgaris subsp. vulgaris]
VFVFKVPPLTSAQGYRAADWDKEPLWTGRLRIVRKGSQAMVLLEHTDKGGHCFIVSRLCFAQF